MGEASGFRSNDEYIKAYQFTSGPVTAASHWTSKPGTKSKHTFDGLPSGSKLWFRVAAVGSKGQIVYRDTLPKIVQ